MKKEHIQEQIIKSASSEAENAIEFQEIQGIITLHRSNIRRQ